ncbi:MULTISPECIES: fluoride efflux transporter CrcB [unclassified Staphylococcus]|uniref:fluoride efflux transporter CrcB n=1 Tax=unclassified Staphylococcus TaxID=91994 RepID=UPI0021D157B5|nr:MULTISPECIES: fluoride efflux transporter CrcB [unclassified Staphylococcus]UXR79084.1 fluoride efflux transporter CrcB [Staphylococcus sp. IVB6227]UXR81819.1 fluoride efflux transporter CrcB [Staphylococcus sp. IVB6214]
MKYFIIFVGGSLGALLRYTLSYLPYFHQLPIGTFIANLLGAFLMGFITALTTQLFYKYPFIKKGIATGFVGAFTTFSTFQFELNALFETHAWYLLISYALFSYVGGMLCCFLGYRIGVRPL